MACNPCAYVDAWLAHHILKISKSSTCKKMVSLLYDFAYESLNENFSCTSCHSLKEKQAKWKWKSYKFQSKIIPSKLHLWFLGRDFRLLLGNSSFFLFMLSEFLRFWGLKMVWNDSTRGTKSSKDCCKACKGSLLCPCSCCWDINEPPQAWPICE